MVGCKVNNRMVPIDHIVSTGEIIEVIPGPADKGPSRDWLKIVRTSEARARSATGSRRCAGRRTSRRAVTRWPRSCAGDDLHPDDELDEFIGSCCRRLRQNNAEELYAALGYGAIANCLPKLKEE